MSTYFYCILDEFRGSLDLQDRPKQREKLQARPPRGLNKELEGLVSAIRQLILKFDNAPSFRSRTTRDRKLVRYVSDEADVINFRLPRRPASDVRRQLHIYIHEKQESLVSVT